MPVPLWVGKLNKRVFNPREISKGIRPVLIHEGRQSGKTFRTPRDAHPVDGRLHLHRRLRTKVGVGEKHLGEGRRPQATAR